ncbi:MAG TPA: extracellular solute-binding protein, partial [Bacillota bacterium]|nr:extracellular solute-binding protein [Bacillota bacterium]
MKSAKYFLILFAILVTACGSVPASNRPTTTPPYAREITIYDWTNDMPESIFEDFRKEYGITVKFVSYESQEEAIENMRAGKVYDIVVLDTQFIPGLISSGMLRPINYQNVLNFKYVSANFRDLVYDPGNRYSIPYNWGTTGLVVRSDLANGPVKRWEDLWKQESAGKVLIWRGVERQMMGMALKSLGYSVNSENREELEQALARLLE